jgi:predicted GIY-YIG superfamily endonuclease
LAEDAIRPGPETERFRSTSLRPTIRRMKRPCVYIMANRRNGTLYVGVTSDVARRAFEHRTGAIAGFTRRYDCKLLVWMEPFERMDEAIAREKHIKSGSRNDKLALIERDNPQWRDLYESLNA